MLIPFVITSLASLAFFKVRKNSRKGQYTPARQMVFQQAINRCKDPQKLRMLAATFRDEGLTVQADLLEKRAALRELPAQVRAARRDVLRKAFASNDAAAVLNLADAFDKEGANGAATDLRKYANGLINGQKITQAAQSQMAAAAQPQTQTPVTYEQAAESLAAAANAT